MGGRPTGPVEGDPGDWDPATTDADLHILDHWTRELMRLNEELKSWKDFRAAQLKARSSAGSFSEYKRLLLDFAGEQEISWTPLFDFQPANQDRKAEWLEYYYHKHQHICAMRRLLENPDLLPKLERDIEVFWVERELFEREPFMDFIKEQLAAVVSQGGMSSLANDDDALQQPDEANDARVDLEKDVGVIGPQESISRDQPLPQDSPPSTRTRSKTTQGPKTSTLKSIKSSKVVKQPQKANPRLTRKKKASKARLKTCDLPATEGSQSVVKVGRDSRRTQ